MTNLPAPNRDHPAFDLASEVLCSLSPTVAVPLASIGKDLRVNHAHVLAQVNILRKRGHQIHTTTHLSGLAARVLAHGWDRAESSASRYWAQVYEGWTGEGNGSGSSIYDPNRRHSA